MCCRHCAFCACAVYVQCACAVYTERAVCGNDVARSQSRQMNELPQNIHFTLNLDEMLAGIVCCAPGYISDACVQYVREVCVLTVCDVYSLCAMCTQCVQCVLTE